MQLKVLFKETNNSQFRFKSAWHSEASDNLENKIHAQRNGRKFYE